MSEFTRGILLPSAATARIIDNKSQKFKDKEIIGIAGITTTGLIIISLENYITFIHADTRDKGQTNKKLLITKNWNSHSHFTYE